MVDIAALKVLNTKRWNAMRILSAGMPVFDSVAARLVAPTAKSRYLDVSKQTKIPWYFIAVVHEREASQSWAASLAQGDPWDKVSIHEPRGIGPFASWEAAALYSFEHCAPYASRNTDWTVGGLLTLLEQYNGLGYAYMGHPSPYLWAGTDQYISGKYIADGHYDPRAVDTQLGCAGLLSQMTVADGDAKP